MLHTLTIRDLALIESAEIGFSPGLNALSGETGGGKSLVVAALKLLRGEKARADMVRHGADELRVDGEFRLGSGDRSRRVLEMVRELCGVVPEDDMLILSRIVDKNGRGRARIDGQPVTLAALREIGGWLLEIHGQGESRALMRPEIQCETLDAFAGTKALRETFADKLRDARARRAQLEAHAGSQRERQERLEFLRYQRSEMDALGLAPGELADLEREHRVLAHLDRMRELLGGTLDLLQEADDSASDTLGAALRTLGQAATIDADLAPASELLEVAELNVAEACRLVQSRLARLELDPARLGAVEDRLAELRRALSRFGPGEDDYLRRLAQVREEIDALDGDEQRPDVLAEELRTRCRELAALASELVAARREAAAGFTAAVGAELGNLGMERTELEVEMAEHFEPDRILDEATAHGPTPVDFVVRINPGEPGRSLRETASGGEMARLVLAMKKCLADRDRVPFLVFDEVDAEIGGRLGFAVGRKLEEVSAHHQVLIVTHLPQVAAFAQAHLRVAKKVQRGRTITTVERLDAGAAEAELAAMAGNEGADAAALEEARRMVVKARAKVPVAAKTQTKTEGREERGRTAGTSG